jgi:hypothetical protein
MVISIKYPVTMTCLRVKSLKAMVKVPGEKLKIRDSNNLIKLGGSLGNILQTIKKNIKYNLKNYRTRHRTRYKLGVSQ